MKYMDKSCLLYTNDNKESIYTFKVTLAGLFTRKTRERMVKAFAESGEIIEKKEKENNQHIIIRALIPYPYRILNSTKCKEISEFGPSPMSRFFNYHKGYEIVGSASKKEKSDVAAAYSKIAEHIFNYVGGATIQLNEFRLHSDIKDQLQKMMSGFSDAEKEEYNTDMDELISFFSNHPVLSNHISSLKNEPFFSKLSCLVMLAITWACWENPDLYDCQDLAHIILPSPLKKDSKIPGEEWLNNYIISKKEEAEQKIQKCDLLYKKASYIECANIASQIVKNNFADDTTLGQAYYLLALCYLEHNYQGNLESNNELRDEEKLKRTKRHGIDLMIISEKNYSNDDATEWLRKNYTAKHMPKIGLLSPIAEASGTSRIIYNTENQYTNEFLLSLPKEMQDSQFYKNRIIFASGKEQLQTTIDPIQDTRYLLFDESAVKNYQDLLYILDGISNETQALSNSPSSLTKIWNKTSIYIRVSEDDYAALINTALKRIGEFTIRVYIIDDAKWASQYLLLKHPLYDLMKNISHSRLNKGPININFSIIGNGYPELTKRLIREAYWLSCFSYSGLSVKIHLISEDATLLRSELSLDFPEMASIENPSDHVSSVFVLQDVEHTSCSTSTYNVIGQLNKLEAMQNSLNYYVVNLGDDIQNLNMGIKLRERTIRNCVEKEQSMRGKQLSTIAFYCQDANIAHLSQNIVIHTIDHGNRWYNNYNIHPFGMLRDRYSWDSIDGGYLEQISQSTHLQYCGVKPSDSETKKISKLRDYFTQCYNRDSSMAVALSLPYRLFQIPHEKGEHILPYAPIDFINHEADNEDIIKEMASQFSNVMKNHIQSETIKANLLRYEHNRWLRWAQSRGWVKATPTQVVQFMKDGNPKQQLFVARMHGCICSIEELKDLSDKMLNVLVIDEDGKQPHQNDWKRFADGEPIYLTEEKHLTTKSIGKSKNSYISSYKYRPKDFTTIDLSNIESTHNILQVEWFKESQNQRSDEKL